MEVIVPCAGLSSRFPNMRPKYLLTDYSGKMMIERAVTPYIGKYNITIAILAEHDEKYKSSSKLKEVFDDKVNIVILQHKTKGPADTVYQAIAHKNLSLSSSLLIKDCDSFYTTPIKPGNIIYTCDINKNFHIKNLHAKSYTVTNDQGIIVSVVEKQIASNNFCAGGYQFETVSSFCNAYEKVKDADKEIFISHIIDYLISCGSTFVEQQVSDIVDLGTLNDWLEYNDRPSYFCDIDGVLVKNKHPEDANIEPLIKNVTVLLTEQNRGCKLIFATARPPKFESLTRKMLNELGFINYELIMGINHTKRILINDFAPTLPYPSASAINLHRDADDLCDYIKR